MPAVVGYVRVSTDRQASSGLGQAAQEAAIRAHVKQTGARLVQLFTEVESGTKAARPQLQAALAEAKRSKATLVIARLDRLGRNVGFLSKLLDAGTEFVALDTPGANRMTLQLLMVVAENEARAVSERTRAALAAAKARGQKLGNPENLTHAHRVKGARAVAQRARTKYGTAGALVLAWRREGRSYNGIARDLNALGEELQNWSAEKVRRVEKYLTTPVA